ncbi:MULTISPECIES: GntR family transcriptional regulator [Sinorhizobium]|jgi:DNA-binding GntR family transcriptional regulator|uniref:GntR family transcriptional regulator n=1 Tax=Rhizobium meliloti TaxID=382 RepID=A0A2J0Z6A5_RHIML|nr:MULTISPECIES: GntR family transcriptional regulator [Sinorhizobium]PJR16053.1 GntR family transcriptional regulator [Sinorhizobium meliloti]WEJ18838.1 GntR family transcriptional regulator [Sinorhizobium sp. K101]WEJ39229.1 GntR family transcriptional regulator [Sinorhizobium sp. C101]GCA51062.1 HTH-type transcriptional regulator McbR [Sinorhizobium sp. KGO-5]
MTSLSKLDRGNLSEQVYAAIRGTLMDGRYEPGERLRISGLADELGVSITPVREAIFRLVSEHALEMKAATAIHVRNLAPAELREIQFIRHHLEGESAALAAERITSKQLANLEHLQEAFRVAAGTDPQEASLINRQFHFAVVAASDLPLVFATVENMWTLMGPLLRTFHMTVPVRDLTSGAHKHYDLLRALAKRDAAGARAAMQEDIAWGKVLVDWLERQRAGTAG